MISAVSLADNSVLWTFSGDGHLVTSPIVVNGPVVIGASGGNVYALDAAAGDGLLVVPAGDAVVAYTLSTNP